MGSFVPPFCPNPSCPFHRQECTAWCFIRAGFFHRHATPHRIQRYRCCQCRRHFSTQTFSTTYWLRHPHWQLPLFHRLLGCSALRQIAREFGCSHASLVHQAARLGRHCLLFHDQHRPRTLGEPLCLDGFVSFEFGQYSPTSFHVAVGRRSHYFYGFTASEQRRSGSMRPAQRRRRAALEARFGRPDPRAVERDVAELLRIVAPEPQVLELHTDEHQDYPRAIGRVPHLKVQHRTISSRAARTRHNPLFPINLLDLLIRHSGANHKRETLAFSKRRQGAIERLAVFLCWRNYVKHFSERHRAGSPAMRLGLLKQPLTIEALLRTRLFPTRCTLPSRWQDYYFRRVATRFIPHNTTHQRVYAG